MFTFSDGHGGVQVTTIPVQISPANEVPEITELAGGEPDPITGTITGTIAATDGDNDGLVYRGVSEKGVTVEVDSTGVWSYTPSAQLRHGPDLQDVITFTVDDSHGGVISANVTVTIAAAIEQPRLVGWPGGSLVTGSTGIGYALVVNEDGRETTVAIVTPDGTVRVAGKVTGTTSFEWDGQPDIVERVDGSIAFLTFEATAGSWGETTTRLVTVTTGGTMNVELVGSQGRFLTAADGTVYYVALAPREDDEPSVGVWRLTADGEIHTHTYGYEAAQNDSGREATVGTDGTLYLAVGQVVPGAQFHTRASLWTISATGAEATYALTSLTGTDITDLSYPHEVTLAADGTAYLVATTVALADDAPTQAAGVLVVGADGSVHRVALPGVPASANHIVAVGDYGVLPWFDANGGWLSVIDAAGNMTHHPNPTATGDIVAATDGSGAYLGTEDGILYVSPAGTVTTLDVGWNGGQLIAGPDGTVYLLNMSGDLVSLSADAITTTPVGGTASLSAGSVEFSADGTPFLLVDDAEMVQLSVGGDTGPGFSQSGWETIQFEVVGDAAILVGQAFDRTRLVAVAGDGTTLVDRSFSPPTGYPVGPVEFADGTFYVTCLEQPASDIYITHVWAVDAATATEVFTGAGAPAAVWNPGSKTVTVGSDGTVFVSLTEYEDPETVLTKIYVV